MQVVRGKEGEEEPVEERTTTSSEEILQVEVGGIERDAEFYVRVEACTSSSVLPCRRSEAIPFCE